MEAFKAIVEKAPQALCISSEGMILFLNPAARALLGLEDSSSYQDETFLFEEFVHPKDRILLSPDVGTHQSGGLWLLRIISRKGNTRWVKAASAPLNWEGREATLWSLSDITEQKRLEEELRASEERYRKAIEYANDGVAIVKDERHVFVNQRFLDIFGYERPEEVLGRPITITVHPDDREKVREFNLRRQKGEPVPSRYTFKGIRENGAPIFVEVSATRITYQGEPASLVYVRDVTERMWLEDALRRSRDFYLALFEELPTMIWRLGLDGTCDYVNKAWLEFTGRDLTREMGDGWLEVFHPEDLQGFTARLKEALRTREPFSMELRARRGDGLWRWVLNVGRPFQGLDGKFSGFIGASYDITERKEREEELHIKATHDPLTALPNRRLLDDRLEVALAQATRRATKAAVIIVDLDQFKEINDQLGHRAGDELLVETGRRLRKIIRGGDTVARIGGDEFVILLPEIPRKTYARRVAKRILEAFGRPFTISGREVQLTPSLGISIFPDHGATGDLLIQRADEALYKAKAMGGNRAVVFSLS